MAPEQVLALGICDDCARRVLRHPDAPIPTPAGSVFAVEVPEGTPPERVLELVFEQAQQMLSVPRCRTCGQPKE